MPSDGPQIWVVRHGDTEWTLSGQHTGRSDIPLVKTGREQALALRPLLTSRRFGSVLTSPLRRATETAALAGFTTAAADVDLVEWDYGSYDGVTSAEIAREDPGWVLWEGGGPGGESPEAVGLRADRVALRLRATTSDVLLFSHGHFLRVLAARWLGLPPSDGRYFYIGTAGVGVLASEGEAGVVRAWNLSGGGGPA